MIPTGVIKVIRASVVLTNAYVAGTVIEDCERYNQLMVFLKFTKGDLSRLEVKIEFSYDGGDTYYSETFSSILGGESTDKAGDHRYGDGGNFVIAIPIKCSKIKISAQGTGTVTNSLLKIDAIVGVS